jgi:osmotically inducible protein OsmC
MAFANTLRKKGHVPQQVQTRAIWYLSPQPQGVFKITKMRLETRGQVDGLDNDTFKQIADEAEKGCQVSNALRGSLKIEVDPALM